MRAYKNSAFCFFLLAELCVFISKAQTTNWEWEKKMGGFYSDGGLSIALDRDKNIYTTGSEGGSADFDPGQGNYFLSQFANNIQNAFISKLDSAGNFIWAKSLGTSNTFTKGHGIALDLSGNVYVTGEFSDSIDFDPDSVGIFTMKPNGITDVFILKLDSSGNFIWAKQLGGSNYDLPDAITTDDFGNVYTTGHFGDTADFDPDTTAVFNLIAPGNHSIFISKLDSSGNFIWAKQLAGTVAAEATSIAVDHGHNVYTTGWISGLTDFDPGAGTFNLTTLGIEDIFVSKLDSSGNFSWAKTVGGRSVDISNCIALDNSGNIYTTGGFIDTVDFDPGSGVYNLITPNTYGDIFILKLNNNGEFIWAKKMGGDFDDWGQSITIDVVGNVISTGWFTSTADFNPDTSVNYIMTDSSTYWTDIFVSKLDSSGNFVWAKSATGTPFSDIGYALVCDSSGDVFVTGSFTSPILMFDSIPLANTGASASDVLVAKINSDISLSVNQIGQQEPKISIFPNPVASQFRIMTHGKKASYNNSPIEVFNLLGERIELNINPEKLIVDCSKLSDGIYFLRIAEMDDEVQSVKFCVQK